MIEIPLTKGCVALVDDRDNHLATFKWHTHENPPGVYARRTIAGRLGRSRIEFMHHAVLGVPSSVQVDHVNGNGLDNRRENLRIASHAQNQANRRLGKNNTSGFKGVYWHRGHGRWRAAIKVSGRKIVLGHFITPEAAARAYDKAALEHFGAYARINFPEMTPEQRHWFEEGRREGIEEAAKYVQKHETGGGWHNVLAAEIRALASRGDAGKER